MSSHLFLVMLKLFLGAAAVGVVGADSRSPQQDGSFLQPSSDRLSEELDRDTVSQHMFKLYEKYKGGDRLGEGNTVRSFRASQGV